MSRNPRHQREVLLEFHYTSSRSVKVIAIDPVTGTEVTMVGDKNQGEAILKRLAAKKLHYVLNKNKEAIRKLESKNKALLDRLLEGTIDNRTYTEAKKRFDEQLSEYEIEQLELIKQNKGVMDFVQFGIYLFKNISELFNKASIITKQKILSSILTEKLVFEKETYRTPKLNKGFEFIYQNIKELNGLKQKNERLSYDNLPFSTEGGT